MNKLLASFLIDQQHYMDEAGKVSITVKSGNITKRCVLVVKKKENKKTEK